MKQANKYPLYILFFIVHPVFAEMQTWTDEEGITHITNVPEECITMEDGNKIISEDCIPRVTGPARPEKAKPEEESIYTQFEKDRKELASLKEQNYLLKEQIHKLTEDINDQHRLVRKFPDSLAHKKSLEITMEKRKETQRKQQKIVRRINYLLFKTY